MKMKDFFPSRILEKYKVKLTDENIQKLFGSEAAEDESFDRLKQYYFKTSVYERITADLPLRIMVGHKGIGKSALFKIAAAEDAEGNNLALFIRPDDISGLAKEERDFLEIIREWKKGLNEIIFGSSPNRVGKKWVHEGRKANNGKGIEGFF
ncbi:MAG: hypothetical protein M0Z48_13945 [Nitrospiraceae bacterium]|nr:hypothetical protein [Nitrospiraceae bacterium]